MSLIIRERVNPNDTHSVLLKYYLLASLISSMAIHILLTKKIKMRIKMVSSVAHVHPEIYTI